MDKPILNPLIIGAGGVASYLITPLLRTFRINKALIIDKDVVEERNLDRQFFDPNDVGHNKALVLVDYMADMVKIAMNDPSFEPDFTAIDDKWFTGPGCIPEDALEGINVIICCADNHEARKNALLFSDYHKIPAVIGGNELFDSEAHLYVPKWEGSKFDPRVMFPEILTDRRGSPLHCQGEQEIHPQLAVANFACAAKIMTLLWRLKTNPVDKLEKLPTSLFESIHDLEARKDGLWK